MAQVLSTNTFGCAKWVVSSDATQGTHTTIANALTSASSGDTIFIRPGTYTENLTLKSGVNLCAYVCDSSLNGTGNVIISGKLSFSSAGSVTISGIQLQTNSDNFLAVTGSAASIVNLNQCYLNCSNNTGISFTSSSSSAIIYANNCTGNLGTTGIAYHSSSSAGTLRYEYCNLFNSGASTTASSNSAGSVLFKFSRMTGAFSTSSTGSMEIDQSFINTSAINTASLTTAGTGSVTSNLSLYSSGTASAISVGSGTTVILTNSTVSSNNTNAITGAGTINYNNLVCGGSSSTINTTTQGAFVNRYSHNRSTLQPGFLAYLNTQDTDVTGGGATYTLGSGNALTEVFDQNGDFNTNGTFTAPYTGRYYLQYTQGFGGVTAGMTAGVYKIVTSNNTFNIGNFNAANCMTNLNVVVFDGSVCCDMDAGDTATYTAVYGNGTNVADSLATSSGLRTYVSGFMLC